MKMFLFALGLRKVTQKRGEHWRQKKMKIKILCKLTVKKEQYTFYINDKNNLDGDSDEDGNICGGGINIQRRIEMERNDAIQAKE